MLLYHHDMASEWAANHWPVVKMGLREMWWLNRSKHYTNSHLPVRLDKTEEMNMGRKRWGVEGKGRDCGDVLSPFAFVAGKTITARGLLLWFFLNSWSVKIWLWDNEFTHWLNLISFERRDKSIILVLCLWIIGRILSKGGTYKQKHFDH